MEVRKSEYGRYMPSVKTAPLKDREVLVLRAVLKTLDIDGIDVWHYRDSGMLFAAEQTWAKIGQGQKWINAEFYRYLLGEVCEYTEDGAVKGLSLDLCEDFYGLCEMHKVNFREYSGKPAPGEVEYVITASDGNGAVYDFLTFSTKAEAEKYCEGCGWQVIDEEGFFWRLDIEERNVSLDGKLAKATERSAETGGHDSKGLDEFVKG